MNTSLNRRKPVLSKLEAIVIDIDGTFLDSKEDVPSENIRAVQEALELGKIVVFASGRMHISIKNLVKKALGKTFPIIAYNGGLVTVNGETCYRKSLERDTAAGIAASVLKKGLYIQAYVDDELVVPAVCDEARAYAEHSGVGFIVEEDFVGFLKHNDTMKLLAIDDHDMLAELKHSLEKDFKGIEAFKSFANYLDIVPKGTNKGEALAFLSKVMGFDLAATAAFGDNDNDVPLFGVCGYAVAMGNATPAAKSAADIIAPGADEAGLAQSLRQLLNRVD